MEVPDDVRRQLEARYLSLGLELDPQKMTAPGLARLVELGFATRATEKLDGFLKAVAIELQRRIASRPSELLGPLLVFEHDGALTLHSVDELLLLAPADQMQIYAKYLRICERQGDLDLESQQQLAKLEANLASDSAVVRKEAISLRDRLERDLQWQLRALAQAIEVDANAEINAALNGILEFATTPQWLLRRERYWESEIEEEFRAIVSNVRSDQISLESLARHPLVGTLTAAPLAGATSLLTLIEVIAGHAGEDVAAEFCASLRVLQPITWSFHYVHAELALVVSDSSAQRADAVSDLRFLCTAIDRRIPREDTDGGDLPAIASAAQLYELSVQHFLASIEMSRPGFADDWTVFEASRIANKFACVAMRIPGLTRWLVNKLASTSEVRKAIRTATGVATTSGAARTSYGIARSLWGPALIALIQRWAKWPGAHRFSASERANMFAAARRAFVVFGLPTGASAASARALLPDLLKDPAEWVESFETDAANWAITSWNYAKKFTSWEDVRKALEEFTALSAEDKVVLLSVFQSGLRQRTWEASNVHAWMETETARAVPLSVQDEDLFEVFLQALLSWAESGGADERKSVSGYLVRLYGANELTVVSQRMTLVYVVICCVRWCKLTPLAMALKTRRWAENVENADHVRSTIEQIATPAPAWIRAQFRAALALLPPRPLGRRNGEEAEAV